MADKRVKYIADDGPFCEVGITGKQTSWRKNQSGYVTEADALLLIGSGKFVISSTAFGTDEDNVDTHAAAHIAMGNPLWQSGLPFWIPPGDGASSGLRFTTDASGAFTLSAAVLTSLVVPSFYAWLPADAAYSGQPAGWYYGTMSTSTAGIIYANTYDPTSQVVPTIPSSPIALPTIGSPKYITQGVAEVTCCQSHVSSIGKNGSIVFSLKFFCSSSATSKTISIRAGSSLLWNALRTSANNDQSGFVVIENCGSESVQICTRQDLFEGSSISTYNNDVRSVNFTDGAVMKWSAQIAANTDSVFVYPRSICATYGK